MLAGAAGLILGVMLLAYANSFSVPLISDDLVSIRDNPSIRTLWPLSAVFTTPAEIPTAGRPLSNLSFALNYAWSGNAVWGYHAVNLALHALAALLLFGVVRRTLERLDGNGKMEVTGARQWGGTLSIALAVALLWSVHPLLTEAVTYISQRTEVLMGLCYLITLYAFIRGAEGSSRAWLSLSVLACWAGMASKEGMVTAPVLVLIYDRCLVAGSFIKAWQMRWRYYLALVASWLLLAVLLTTGLKHRAVGFGLGVTWWNYALTECFVILKYVRLVFWPHPLVFDYGLQFSATVPAVLLTCLAIAILVGGTIVAFFRWPKFGFLPFAFFVLLAPTSSVVPIAMQPMAESRMYLPSAALIAMAALAIRWCAGRKSGPICAGLALPLVYVTMNRNQVYRDPMVLWSDTVAKQPTNPRAYYSLALVSEARSRPGEARRFFESALALKPDYEWAHHDYGRFLMQLGFNQEAQAQLAEALSLKPEFPEAHLNLGVVLRRLGDTAGAIAHYEFALRARPDFPEAHYNLGNALLQQRKFEEAIRHFDIALQLRPDLAEAQNGLGNALVLQGKIDEARRHYESALRLRPGYLEAQKNLGQLRALTHAK